jgi:hypothetical protein
MVKTFPEMQKALNTNFANVEEYMGILFYLIDQDRDGLVDALEFGIGLQRMFPSKHDPLKKAGRVEPASIFRTVDSNEQGALILSDMQKYVQQQLTQIIRLNGQRKIQLSLEEMSHNISVYIFLKADYSREGQIS